MASSQGTSVSCNSFSRWASHDIFLFKYHFILHILRFLFFFSDNIMADVASKQQTTALFLSTTVTRTRRHTELTKNWQTWWKNCAVAREHSVQFFVQFFFFAVKLQNSRVTEYFAVTPYIVTAQYGCMWLHFTLLETRISRWLLDCWKICVCVGCDQNWFLFSSALWRNYVS